MKPNTARVSLISVAAISLLAPSASAATVISTYPWLGATTADYLGVAQTFVPPASDPTLSSWMFGLAPAGGGGVSFSIYEWSGSQPIGPALFTTIVPWPSGGRPGRFGD